MRKSSLNALTIIVGLSLIAHVLSLPEGNTDRQKKHFSLFSVVTFKNEECTSELTGGSGGNRAGTCQTSTECSDMDGMKSGNCAAGFGVCCVMLSATGISAAISQNRTYLRNSEYPTVASATTAVDISYTINKMSSDICQLRLDFVDFVIAGPANSLEVINGASVLTHCTADTLTIISSGSEAEMPIICGALTGEHLYIDMGMVATDTTVVRVTTAVTGTISPATAARLWDIKTSQIECYAAHRAPAGCHRYMTDDIGKIISLNFMRTSTTTPVVQAAAAGQNSGLELANQNIKTCIRRSRGMCCVEYQVCQVYNSIELADLQAGVIAADGSFSLVNDGWSIDLNSKVAIAGYENIAQVDSECVGDYVEIPSSFSAPCGAGHSSAKSMINTRYCGPRFGNNRAGGIVPVIATPLIGLTHVPVCDCSEPFSVTHQSNLLGDDMVLNTASTLTFTAATKAFPRGFCLDFRQAPCYY